MEATGLLTHARDAVGRRRYGATDLTACGRHPAGQGGGLSFEAIRSCWASLAAKADPAKRRDILRQEAEALRSRIAVAQYSPELIECAPSCDHEDFTRCLHFRQMVA